MADINLEKKRRSGAWGWIIALIVLLIILWAIFGNRTEPARTSTSSIGAAENAVAMAVAAPQAPWLADAA